MHVDPSESVVVCPVDPYVEDNYFEALKELSEQSDKCEANLVLMGIEPTYPSEKYGYVIPENADHVATVKTFKEKPTVDVAEQYIAQGALWNGGVFAYKLGYVMNKAHELMDFTDYGMEQKVKAGDVITMSSGCRHTVMADTELKLIEVQLGKDINVHDKQKFELEY